LWLPTLRDFHSRFLGEIKYLTFAGPQGHDLELFAIQQKLIRIENIRIWENAPDVAKRLVQKYGPALKIKQGEAFDLCKAKNEKSFFPFHLVNLDYTSGAFHVDQPRRLPTKLETVQMIINNQEEHATSFLLFLAVAAKADVDNDLGRLFVQKAAFDLAKRLGKTEPLFDLTRDLAKTYPETLATIVPCIVIRMGGEHHFDTHCIGKAVYRPYRSAKTTILSFVFNLEYENVPLTLSSHQSMKLFDESIEDRQRKACALQLIDVNLKIPRRRRKIRSKQLP
jgi:hypothetical protein